VDVAHEQWPVAGVEEGVDLAGLDDQDVTGRYVERLPIAGPASPALPHERHFVIG
jgi:hypothetical protein